MKGLFVLDPSSYDAIYGLPEREQINRLVEIYASPQTTQTVH
jgi:hypothetical protein